MPESNYMKAIAEYRDALKAALVVATDPFKAPELTVETTKSVLDAIWALQVEYAAMLRDSRG